MIYKLRAKLILIFFIFPISLQAYTKKEWVDFYLRDCKPGYSACKQSLEISLGKMIAYSDLTFKYLDKNGLPRWLATIPLIESDYNEEAVSKVGALGMWQLMPFHIERAKTRKRVFFGMEVTMVPTDEQIKKYAFNPVLSTIIATDLLKYLYEKYKHYKECDKYILMAYNAGENRVNDFIEGKELPQETIDYYNKIMAIQHILRHLRSYRVTPVKHKTILIDDYFKTLISMDNEIEDDHKQQAYLIAFKK